MASSTGDNPPAWYTSRRFQVIATIVLAAFAVGQGIVGVCLKDNDFLWHRHLGEAFLHGDPYATGGAHYLPARTMLNALTAWLPYRIDRAIVYLAALATLAWTLRAWRGLADGARFGSIPARRASEGSLASASGWCCEITRTHSTTWAAMVFTLAITGAYIQRDLDECGLQLLLLFFLTAAAVSIQAGRALRCGMWLALAAVYKLTPILFLPYLCYKRQWRAAAWMTVFIAGLCLAPALWLGWDVNQKAHEFWWAQARTTLSADDPAENGVEPPNHRNQSLALAFARLVQTYPPGHVLYLEHPLFVQFGNLEPAAAKRTVQCLLALLAGVLAWRFRKGFHFPDPAGELSREWAAVTLLTAILSPLCWVQHLVLVLPAVFLLVRAALEPEGMSSWQRRVGCLAALIMIFAGQRDLLGHGLFMVAMSYKVHTWAALTALVMVLTARSPSRAVALSMDKGRDRTESRLWFNVHSKSA